MTELSGRCSCGAVSWKSNSPVLWAAFCHCEDCRRAASSDYVSWFGLKRSQVEWRGPRQFYQSSDLVTRSFCADCGTPLSFETDVFPDETHLYAAMLGEPSIYKPTAHLFWSERVPWISVSDDLPKHPKGLQHAAQNGQDLL